MTASHRLTPYAAEGVVRIVDYVDKRFGPDVAARVIEELEHAFEALALSPLLGHRRSDLTRDARVRFWSVGPTLIAYRCEPAGIEILSVERGDVDWKRMLSTRLE